MADLTIDATDLGIYLGTEVDAARGQMLIDLALALASSIVSPVPEQAKAVILTSAGRAYVNPSGVTSQAAGPYQVSMPSAGVYLTKTERAALRRLSGGGGAFSIDLIPGYPDSRFAEET